MAIRQFLCLLLLLASAFADATSVSVSSDLELKAALVDESINEIVIEQHIVFDREHWTDWYSRHAPFVRNTNLTVRGFPPLRRLDFSFAGDGQMQLAPGVTLNLTNVIIEHARYGAGITVDLLATSPGSYLVLWDSVMFRMVCITSTREPDAVAVQPRLPGFPGQQRAVYKDKYCIRRSCFDQVLVYEDYTRITGTNSEDTAAGGYAMVMHNFTKVCRRRIDNCSPQVTVEECIRNELDVEPDILTPGAILAALEAEEAQRRRNSTIGAIAGSLFGAAILLGAVGWLWRRRTKRLQAIKSKQYLLPTISAAPAGSGPNADAELGLSDSARKASSPMKPKDLLAPGTPPSTHNSWELAACKTSDRFLHSRSHSQHVSGNMDGHQHWPSHTADTGSWCMRAADAGRSNDLRSHDGSPTTAELIAGEPVNIDKVSLGVLLGAGSFGRVYKGRWRGMDVAVKVLQHSRAAAASVANEVDLMMSFQHPNIVSAHHFVTWRKRQRAQATLHAAEAYDEPQQERFWAASFDNVFADAVGPTGEYPEDTQTWIVQEFCDSGSLSDYVANRRQQQEGQLLEGHSMLRVLFRLREVAEGMSHLHGRAVVHGDLKSGNVLLTSSPTSPYGKIAKITDFGLSRAMTTEQTHRSTHTLGTVSHMAPELLRHGKMAPAADVFSFGIMMWELLTGGTAFKGLHYGAIIERVALMGERPPLPQDIPDDFLLLMCNCWSADPDERPSFEQVMRCLDIMITSRQQEMTEQHMSSIHSGSFNGQQLVPGTDAQTSARQSSNVGFSLSSGEFEMVSTHSHSGRYHGLGIKLNQSGHSGVLQGTIHEDNSGSYNCIVPQDL